MLINGKLVTGAGLSRNQLKRLLSAGVERHRIGSGLLAESGSRHHDHAGFTDQPGYELLVRARNLQPGKGIESRLRRKTMDIGNGIEKRNHYITASF